MSFNINAQSLANMTPEELQTYINSQLATLSTPEEIDEFRDAVNTALDDYRTEVQDQIDEMRDVIRGRGHRADRLEGADLEEANRILDELENELDDIDNALGNAEDDITTQATHQAMLDQDISDQPNPTINGDNYETSSDLPPPEYTIHVGSGNGLSSNPWDPDGAGESDFDQYLKDQEILDDDGHLMTGKTYHDIEAARTAWLAEKRVVTFSLPAGSTIEFAGEEDGIVTFKITDKDGKVAYLHVEGDAYFRFTGGMSPEYVQSIRDLWPPELINRSLWGDKLFTELMNPVTPEQERAYVDGYAEGATAPDAASPYLGTALTDAEKAEFQTYWDKLYQALAEGKPIGPVWDEILDTASPKLIEALIFAIAKRTPQHFSALLSGQTALLENVITGGASDEDLTSVMRLAILLLETYAGPGNYGGGATLLDTLFAHVDPADAEKMVAGRWSGEDGEWAVTNGIILGQFNELSARLTGPHGNINAAIENETNLQTSLQEVAEEETAQEERVGGEFTISDDIYAHIVQNGRDNAEDFNESWTYDWNNEWVTTENAVVMRSSLIALFDELKAGEFTMREAADFISTFCAAIPGSMKNNFACMIVYVLDREGLLDQLMEHNPLFAANMWTLANEDPNDDHPYMQSSNYDNDESLGDWNVEDALLGG